MSGAYYNEHDPFAAQWLRNLISRGLIAPGEVDERSIVDVRGDDLRGFTQCHFFAGIGGWSRALRLAGWGDDRPVWTGSCPCQPLSVAGQQKGADDERHLWPAFHNLIAECKPAIVFGEQVASALGREWLAGVRADLEADGYACGAADLCAAGVGAPHIRQRLFWIALADAGRSRSECVGLAIGARLEGHAGHDADGDQPGRLGAIEGGSIAATGGGSSMANAGRGGQFRSAQPDGVEVEPGQQASCGNDADGRDVAGRRNFWADAEWRTGADGKTRRVKSGVCLLAHGLPNRVGRLRGYGNAIVPQVAAKFIEAVM